MEEPNIKSKILSFFRIAKTSYQGDKRLSRAAGRLYERFENFDAYLANNEIVYDKQKMNGKYQVDSGRIVAVVHDTPFIDDSISHPSAKSNPPDENSSIRRALPDTTGAVGKAKTQYTPKLGDKIWLVFV